MAAPSGASKSTDPFESLRSIYAGYAVARSVHVIAELGVADALDDAPRAAAELAGAVGAHAEALDRVLRLLSSHGIFEAVDGHYRHSPASRLLRSDHPQSVRPLARMFGLPVNWSTSGAMMHSIRTGRPATEKTMPDGIWAHFAAHPEESEIFNAAMAAKARAQIGAVVSAYDFSRSTRVGDIGGGRGHLLAAILQASPRTTGVLFDLPHVIADAARIASERLSLQAGDFFKDPLPECDAYTLMEVIHDWGDTESIAILGAVRRSAKKGATLLLIEEIIPEDPGPHWAKLLDIFMLTLAGGKQRTLAEYERLFRETGFTLLREIPTPMGVSIIEAQAS